MAGHLVVHEKLDNGGKQINNSPNGKKQFCHYEGLQFMEVGCQGVCKWKKVGDHWSSALAKLGDYQLKYP